MRQLIFICNILAMSAIAWMPLTVAAGNQPRSLYDGAGVWFAQAQLLKPRENNNHSRAHQLAPLFVQEISTPSATPPSNATITHPEGFGAGKPSDAVPKVVHAVQFQSGSVVIHGQTHEQMTFAWSYGKTKPPQRRPPARRGPDAPLLKRTQTAIAPELILRLTLGTNGIPAIYEVFYVRRDVQLIFVSQAIEAAAQAEFGSPLPGRRHAVEQSLDAAPKVVVARVIENSPDVMGPIVHLSAESGGVATLICRCMATQAKALAGQGFYELVPGNISGNLPAATRLDAADPRGLPKDFFNSSDRLSRSLRLPRGF